MRLSLFLSLAASGCLLSTSPVLASIPPHSIPIPAQTEILGAASAPEEINHPDSIYFPHIDFFNLKGNSHLTMLTGFPAYQQTTEYTCAPAAALTILYYFGDTSQTEASLAEGMKSVEHIGTSPDNIMTFLRASGWQVQSSLESLQVFPTYESFAAFVQNNLKKKIPIMVENVDWSGHWRVIIGYDTMGTNSPLDDTLILADPYDTCDHIQDGYTIQNGEKFYSMWFDHSMLPEEQRSQPWVIIQPKQNP